MFRISYSDPKNHLHEIWSKTSLLDPGINGLNQHWFAFPALLGLSFKWKCEFKIFRFFFIFHQSLLIEKIVSTHLKRYLSVLLTCSDWRDVIQERHLFNVNQNHLCILSTNCITRFLEIIFPTIANKWRKNSKWLELILQFG